MFDKTYSASPFLVPVWNSSCVVLCKIYAKMRKKILVTGGAGFIGSHLCERLLADGNEVIVLDNFFTGSRQKVEHLLHNSSFTLLRHDITFPYFEKVDCIYNLACPSAPGSYMRDPVMTLKTSLIGTINILELAKRMQARVVQASSAEVYGKMCRFPVSEEYRGSVDTVGEGSSYAEGKRAAETICMAYRNQYGVDVRIARLFHIYGPGMPLNDGRLLSGFIRSAFDNEPLVIRGNAAQMRSFLYIDDAIDALIRLMDCNGEIAKPVNIGSVESIRIDALAEDVVHLTNSQSKIICLNLRSDSAPFVVPEIGYAQKQLGWEPTVSIEEGLIRTIKEFDRVRKANQKSFAGLSWVEIM